MQLTPVSAAHSKALFSEHISFNGQGAYIVFSISRRVNTGSKKECVAYTVEGVREDWSIWSFHQVVVMWVWMRPRSQVIQVI